MAARDSARFGIGWAGVRMVQYTGRKNRIMKPAYVFCGCLLWIGTSIANGDAVQWTENGHWYEAVATGGSAILWTDAQAAAASRGGYLATITSAEENTFVFNLIDDQSVYWHYEPQQSNNWGPWIGGFQPSGSTEPDGNWQWVTAEAFGYSNWRSGEPNDSPNQTTSEEYISFMNYQQGATPRDVWNDGPDDAPVAAYVIEWNQSPNVVPTPSTFVMLISLGAMGLLRKRAREWAKRVA
jgi:hypothetical protein